MISMRTFLLFLAVAMNIFLGACAIPSLPENLGKAEQLPKSISPTSIFPKSTICHYYYQRYLEPDTQFVLVVLKANELEVETIRRYIGSSRQSLNKYFPNASGKQAYRMGENSTPFWRDSLIPRWLFKMELTPGAWYEEDIEFPGVDLGPRYINYKAQVVGWEDIKSRAGILYRTIRVREISDFHERMIQAQISGRYTVDYWFSPETGCMIKVYGRGGHVATRGDYEIIELIR